MNRTGVLSRCLGGSIAVSALIWIAVGCGGQPSAQEALRIEGAKHPEAPIPEISKFAGKVTIDGGPPPPKSALVVALTPDTTPVPDKPSRTVLCDAAGNFEFTTYVRGDGVQSGKYIVTFSQLTRHGKSDLLGPDGLKNLYSDPDKSQFKVEIPPDKPNAVFELEVAGKDPIARPSAKAFAPAGMVKTLAGKPKKK